MKRVLVERKDLSRGSTWVPSAPLPLPLLSFCTNCVRDPTTSDIGGRNSFTGCSSFNDRKNNLVLSNS